MTIALTLKNKFRFVDKTKANLSLSRSCKVGLYNHMVLSWLLNSLERDLKECVIYRFTSLPTTA